MGATLVANPRTTSAQRASARKAQIAFLNISSPQAIDPRALEEFRRGLADNGLVEDRDITVEYFWAEGNPERLRKLAGELAQRPFDVILTAGPQPVRALLAAHIKAPIVFAIYGDPLGDKIVDNLARPGKNITGLSMLNTNLESKRLQVLKEASSTLKRVVLLHDPSMGETALADAQTAAESLALETLIIKASEPAQFESELAGAANDGANGIAVMASPLLNFHRRLLITLAIRHRFPSIWEAAVFVKDGGLLSYGPNFPDMYRRSTTYIAKILNGARPGDLPVEQPAKFELAVNLKTATAIGLTIPPTLLARADEVIE